MLRILSTKRHLTVMFITLADTVVYQSMHKSYQNKLPKRTIEKSRKTKIKLGNFDNKSFCLEGIIKLRYPLEQISL